MERFPRTATNIIAAITGLAWVLTALAGYSAQAAYVLGFIPLRVTAAVPTLNAVPVFLTPLTATLAHAGLVHLGFNLLILVWCGAQVERVLGVGGLVALYLVGAYAAAGAQWAMDPHGATPMIGASGAISAVMGAFALSFGRAKAFTSNLRVNRWINVLWLMVAWVVLQVMMTWLAGGEGYLLATPAHIGGFAAGLLLQRPLLLWRYRKA
ncbi:rhomboid family intramembrane serine protease [Sphingomonas flavescens]|uniref:rhomboid family intramembrane serine protease n=1 Tax=Sphingomonas flavescens TaxID=3132797 RepID=UPI002805B0ED|nr:rhomboid family intramembrane serine protease [Sphingomonas limnosediminicola]